MEQAGAAIMQRKPLTEVGAYLVNCGQEMKQLATCIEALAPTTQEAQESGQRMSFAADQMIVAGTELTEPLQKKDPTKRFFKQG